MNAKLCLILCFVLVVGEISAILSHKAGNCPLRDSVHLCTPRCQSDYQCAGGKKCCPNICGTTSCTSSSAVSTGSGGYKGSSRDAAVYCAGVKCGPYEKCVFDRNTKREKCVRT